MASATKYFQYAYLMVGYEDEDDSSIYNIYSYDVDVLIILWMYM